MEITKLHLRQACSKKLTNKDTNIENHGVCFMEKELYLRYKVTKNMVDLQWIYELDSWLTQCYLLKPSTKHDASC